MNDKSPGDQQLDDWLAKGAPVDAGPWAFLGCFTYLGYLLAFPGIPIGFILWLWNLLETGRILNP